MAEMRIEMMVDQMVGLKVERRACLMAQYWAEQKVEMMV